MPLIYDNVHLCRFCRRIRPLRGRIHSRCLRQHKSGFILFFPKCLYVREWHMSSVLLNLFCAVEGISQCELTRIPRQVSRSRLELHEKSHTHPIALCKQTLPLQTIVLLYIIKFIFCSCIIAKPAVRCYIYHVSRLSLIIKKVLISRCHRNY